MKRAFITGGAGFLGWHIVQAVKKRGAKAVIYDTKPPLKEEEGIEYVQGDIADLEKMQRALKGCDYFFHAAAIANIDETRSMAIPTMEVNVTGTAKCLEATHRAGLKRFLFASSVYVASNRGSFYRVSKLAGELLCRIYWEEFKLPYTIVRYGSLYGRNANEWNFIYKFCREVLETGSFDYYGTGEEIREFINAEDAARETVNVSELDEYAGKAVLITGHQRMYMKDFFNFASEILGKKVNIRYLANKDHLHYKSTPYSFEPDLSIRINMKHYIDISEGILSCLQDIHKTIKSKEA